MTSALRATPQLVDRGRRPTSSRARLCARLRGLCELLRLAHQARVPF